MNDPALDGFMMWFLSFALLCLGGQDSFMWLARAGFRKARRRIRRARLRRRNLATYRRLLEIGALQGKAGT